MRYQHEDSKVSVIVFRESLTSLKEKNIFREIKDRESPQGSRIIINGKRYINFSSNDYLGLANHPAVIKAVKNAISKFGFGSGASRLLGGGSTLHKELEKKTAIFKRRESALIFNSGYAANTGVIPALAEEGDAVFSDELNHSSIVDGCRLSKAKTFIYRHKDISHLKGLLKKVKARKKIIITDGVFSMDGDIAPLKDIYNLCLKLNANSLKPSVLLYMDDAHGTGILGDGRGSLEHFGLKPKSWIIQMGTFSKALGSLGAFVAGDKDTISWILNNARSFIFSTALPSCVIAASIASIKLIEDNPSLIKKLRINRERTVKGVLKLGYDITDSETPIIPIKTGSIEKTLQLSRYLFKKGIYAPAIRPPTVKEPRIRLTVTATHTDEDIEILIGAFNK
ncbi:MAG: 8-amino-7-oxononanoate synthase [Nitrospirae bacterium]|nr:8-amino-7-oxononanoate synthase [Nitrospirota bacterium]